MERLFSSTIVELNTAAALAISHLGEASPKPSLKAVFNTIIAAYQLESLTCIELKEIVSKSGKSIATVRNALKLLENSPGAYVGLPSSKYKTVNKNVKLIHFPRIEEVERRQFEKAELITGSKSKKKVLQQLEHDNIHVPETYRKMTSEFGTQMPMSPSDSALVAFGKSIMFKKSFTDPVSRQINFAESVSGVINEFDVSILDLLLQKSVDYFHSLPRELFEKLDHTKRIPIFIEDLLIAKNLKNLTEHRMALSQSIVRIWNTQHIVHDQYFSKSKNGSSIEHERFQYFTSMRGVAANAEEPLMNSDGQLSRPYVSVNIAWSKDIFDYILHNSSYIVQNVLINTLPTTLYTFYRKLRIFMYVGQLRPLTSTTVSLEEIVRVLWSTENEATQHKICSRFISDIYRLAKNSIEKDLVKFTPVEGDERAKQIAFELGGFYCTIEVPNPDRIDNAANRRSPIFIDYREQAVIEHAGAKYNPSKGARNTATIANPFLKKSRQIFTALKRYKRFEDLKFNNVISEYYVEFELDNEVFLITKYMDQDELGNMVTRVADYVGAEYEMVYVFFNDKIAKLKKFPFDVDKDITALVEDFVLPKESVLRYMCNNLRSLNRLKREDYRTLIHDVSETSA